MLEPHLDGRHPLLGKYAALFRLLDDRLDLGPVDGIEFDLVESLAEGANLLFGGADGEVDVVVAFELLGPHEVHRALAAILQVVVVEDLEDSVLELDPFQYRAADTPAGRAVVGKEREHAVAER